MTYQLPSTPSRDKITTIGSIPLPPSKIIPWFQNPPNILDLNPLGASYTKKSDEPLVYSIIFDIPILFGLFKIPVTTEAVFSVTEDGLFVTTNTYGIKTSSDWRVTEQPLARSTCSIREDFELLSGWWGLGWFIMGTARKEHLELMTEVTRELEKEFGLD